MKICPLTYEDIAGPGDYSLKGLHRLSARLDRLAPLPFTEAQLRQEAVRYADKLSIQGVQYKLSARLDISKQCFVITAKNGRYILKPQSDLYPQLPENEDLSMRLAKTAGIETPLHGMVYGADRQLTYFIKRFDRCGQKSTIPLEDFAQLSQLTRDTKYQSSMEKVAVVLDRFCTFPVLEKTKLLRRTLVAFLIGNEDMHLKNFSLIHHQQKVELSPCYDFINSTIALKNAKQELAIPLNGKKHNLRRKDFIEYYAHQKLGLTRVIIDKVLSDIEAASPEWQHLIACSFLSADLKEHYQQLVTERFQRLFF